VALARPRYERSKKAGRERAPGITGHRHGSRVRSLTGSFGPIEIAVPRARLNTADRKSAEWKSQSLWAYQRRTPAADALIASRDLSGTNTRRVRRALSALFAGAVGKGTVSRVWRKVKSDWDAWNARSLAEKPNRVAISDTAAMLFWALLASGQINMQQGRWLERHKAHRSAN
jgi:transposase-like protein